LEIQTERLEDEFLALKTALEEAIIAGERSMCDFGEIPCYTLVSKEHSISAHATARPEVVGWVEDF
jgi:hypothetical protein